MITEEMAVFLARAFVDFHDEFCPTCKRGMDSLCFAPRGIRLARDVVREARDVVREAVEEEE
jgi:hypothetical protein